MAATFVVEDGSGKSDANSYSPIATADQYNLDYNAVAAWTNATDPNKEKALRIASQYLDAAYGGRWLGSRTYEAQALNWPRIDAIDQDGYTHSSTALPAKLVDACIEAAILSVGDENLMPDLADPGTIKRKKVKVDVIEKDVTYVGGNSPIKKYRKIESLVRSLIYSSGQVFRA